MLIYSLLYEKPLVLSSVLSGVNISNFKGLGESGFPKCKYCLNVYCLQYEQLCKLRNASRTLFLCSAYYLLSFVSFVWPLADGIPVFYLLLLVFYLLYLLFCCLALAVWEGSLLLLKPKELCCALCVAVYFGASSLNSADCLTSLSVSWFWFNSLKVNYGLKNGFIIGSFKLSKLYLCYLTL